MRVPRNFFPLPLPLRHKNSRKLLPAQAVYTSVPGLLATTLDHGLNWHLTQLSTLLTLPGVFRSAREARLVAARLAFVDWMGLEGKLPRNTTLLVLRELYASTDVDPPEAKSKYTQPPLPGLEVIVVVNVIVQSGQTEESV